MRRHTPAQQLHEAKQIAHDHGLKVVERPTPNGRDYLLFRIVSGRAVYVGKRSSESGIRSMVCKACNFH